MVIKSQTQIKTSLPYCLYKADGRFFKIGDAYNSKIRFTKIITIPNRRISAASNIETIRDRWGIDAHSDVEIYTDKEFKDNNEEAETFALQIINDVIRKYMRFDKKALHLVRLIKEDLFGFLITKDGKGRIGVSFSGGITASNPIINYDISNQLEKAIREENEVPLWENLLLNSHQYIYQGEYRHAILESIIALELVISNFIRKLCIKKGISQKNAEEYIKNVGLTGNVEVTIRLLLNNVILPSKEVFLKCKSGITIRNAIVHKGRKDATENEAKDSLKNSEILITFLLSQI